MKKIIPILAFLVIVNNARAQNVGINTPGPTSALDINGGLRLRAEVTPVAGTSVMLTSNRAHHVLSGSPSGNFTIAFIGATESGQHVIITNSTLFDGFMVPVTIRAGVTAEFIYSSGAWKLIGSNEAIATTAWALTGNGGTIDGVNNFIGTTDNMPLRFIQNGALSGLIDNDKYNYFFGFNSGRLTTGYGNTSLGSLSLHSNRAGISNVAIGYDVLASNRDGVFNTSVGSASMARNRNGGANVAVGRSAMFIDTASSETVAIGSQALYNNQNRSGNTAVGANALYNNTKTTTSPIGIKQGMNNTAIGNNVLVNNRRGSGAVAIGYMAAFSDTTAEGIIAIGRNALYNNNGRTGNVGIGDSALFNNGVSGTEMQSLGNTAIGAKSMLNNTEGSHNTSLGFISLSKNTIGQWNTAIGSWALANNDIGGANVAIGSGALSYSKGSQNTAVGVGAMENHLSGSWNVAIGRWALQNNAHGESNVAIGYGAGSSETGSGKLYIENNIFSNKDNSLIYGDFDADSLLLNAKTVVRNNAIVRGFTKLGGYSSDVPSIKMKEITGIGPAINANMPVAHGLNAAKIISVQIFMEYGASPSPTKVLPPNYTLLAGYEYQYEIDGASI